MADELQRVGLVFKADGTVNFQKSLKEVNAAVNENRSAFKLAKSEWNDSTSQMQKLRDTQDYLTSQTQAYSDKVRRLTEILNNLENTENRNEKAIAETRTQLNNAQASLNNYQKGLDDTTKSLTNGTAKLEDMANKLDKVGQKSTAAGNALTKGLTAPIAAVGVAAAASWQKIDTAYDNIAAGTGATGEALGKLQDSFDNVYGNFKADSESTSKAIADINTRFNFTGETLESCSKDFLKFAEVNNTDVSSAIETVSRYMADANIESSQYSSVLDALTAASQSSGISVDSLAESLTKYGAPMRALGLSTQQGIALFAQWEKAGVNTEIAMSGMKKSISTWAAEGKDAKVEFQKTLDTIASAPDIATATTEAIEVFGVKAGPDLADAIQNGRFSVEDFMKVVQNSEGQLSDSFDAMQDGPDKAQVALHQLQLAGSDLAETAMTSFAPTLNEIIEDIKQLCEWFKELDPNTKEMIIKIALLVATIGPLLIIFGKMASGISSIITMVKLLIPAFASLNAVIAANSIIFIVAAIVALIAILVVLYIKCEWFRDGVNKIGREIKKGFEDIVDFFKENWQGILLFLVNPFAGAFKLLYDNCGAFRDFIDGIVEDIKDAWGKITQPFKDAIKAVKEGWQELKESIKMPHFDISGSFSITPPRTPKLSVDWYAKGGILNSPTIFGANGGKLMGGGEAGPEAVLPISNLMDYMRKTNAESNVELINMLIKELPAALIEAFQTMPLEVSIYLGNKLLGKEFTDIVVKNITLNSQNKNAMKGAL